MPRTLTSLYRPLQLPTVSRPQPERCLSTLHQPQDCTQDSDYRFPDETYCHPSSRSQPKPSSRPPCQAPTSPHLPPQPLPDPLGCQFIAPNHPCSGSGPSPPVVSVPLLLLLQKASGEPASQQGRSSSTRRRNPSRAPARGVPLGLGCCVPISPRRECRWREAQLGR